MAKRKRKEQETAEERGDAYEPPAARAETDGLSDWPPAADEQTPSDGEARAAADGQPPSSRPARMPRSVLSRAFLGKKVELIDDLNAGGLGIRLSYDDPAERPSEE